MKKRTLRQREETNRNRVQYDNQEVEMKKVIGKVIRE